MAEGLVSAGAALTSMSLRRRGEAFGSMTLAAGDSPRSASFRRQANSDDAGIDLSRQNAETVIPLARCSSQTFRHRCAAGDVEDATTDEA
ncbi:MAG: hypothetical protein ABSF29_08810 [Tepidisphaeraceae bacterium]|jgi:hypothetical protein